MLRFCSISKQIMDSLNIGTVPVSKSSNHKTWLAESVQELIMFIKAYLSELEAVDKFKTSACSQIEDEWVLPGSDCMKVNFNASYKEFHFRGSNQEFFGLNNGCMATVARAAVLGGGSPTWNGQLKEISSAEFLTDERHQSALEFGDAHNFYLHVVSKVFLSFRSFRARSAVEKSISNGVQVPEVQITTLIEMLMGQAMKLDNIAAERDALAQKSLQGKRVEKCVETLDMLKISNGRAEPVAVTTEPSRRPLILHQCHATMELFD
ncbi:hypothetical protein J1N35_024888 [Gossypium stocksii]|uniref:BAG domain-containing protein n=1 Tax=Gossypium stocksii TaxID=47602 RepID=A0A9D3V5Z3_9ROSI|nr:hypothetical protein J1N35_024888 [Gossypium stocksii]